MTAAPTSGQSDSVALPPRRVAGPGAHIVGQGLTVTAASTSDQHSPTVSLVYGPGGRARRGNHNVAHDWSGHPRLERSISRQPDPLPAREAVPNSLGF